MKNQKSKKELVKSFLEETPLDLEYFVKHSMDFAVQIIEMLKRMNISQKDLAKLLGKEESEISKWLSGNHNFTLKSIAKIEASLDKQLIFTRDEIRESFFPFLFRKWKMEQVESGRLDTMITLYTQTENYVSTARTINFEYIEPPAKFTMISVTSADGTKEESQQNIKESSSNYGFSKNMVA